MPRAHLEKIEKEIQKKLLQENLKKWDGLEVDIVVLKWKDKRDVLLILIAHTSQIVTISNRLRIGKQKPNIVTDSNNSIWIWLQRPDIALPLRIKKKFEVVQKVGVQILVIFITNPFYLYQKFSSHRELCHLVKFREVIIKNLLGERKKLINDTNGPTSTTHKQFLTVKRRETYKTLLAMLEERNKKRITICL